MLARKAGFKAFWQGFENAGADVTAIPCAATALVNVANKIQTAEKNVITKCFIIIPSRLTNGICLIFRNYSIARVRYG